MEADLLFDPQNINAVAFGILFLAGLLSFLSPCVLPLVPAYIGYLSGATVGADGLQKDTEGKALRHAFAFVGGFGVLFVVAGAGIGFAGALVSAAGSEASGGQVFDAFLFETVLARIGSILLAVLAVRVADTHLDGDWRLRVGSVSIAWPAELAGVPQKYVRWAIVGALTAGAVLQLGLLPPDLLLLDAIILGVAVLAGVGVGPVGAAALGVVVAGIDLYRLSISPAALYGPATMALEAGLIFLIMFFVSRTTMFYQDRRLQVTGRFANRGYLTSGIMGAVFAAGWTPCTGPNLGIAIGMAGASETAASGAALLSTYALGLGIPFILVGFAFGSATRMLRRLTPYMNTIKLVNAGLLLAMAALIMSKALQTLSGYGTFFEDILGVTL